MNAEVIDVKSSYS